MRQNTFNSLIISKYEYMYVLYNLNYYSYICTVYNHTHAYAYFILRVVIKIYINLIYMLCMCIQFINIQEEFVVWKSAFGLNSVAT